MAILCHCEGVRDREIEAAVVGGADSVEAVTAACGAGRGCGTCHVWIRQVLAAHGVPVEEPVSAA